MSNNDVTDKTGTCYDVEKLQRRLDDIDTGIARSRKREIDYLEKRDERSAWIEETVQDRLLRERLVVTS